MKALEKLKKLKNKADQPKLSEEAAVDQLALMINYYDVDIDDIDEGVAKILISAIRKGKVEIKEQEDKNNNKLPVLSQRLVNDEIISYDNSITIARANMDFKDQKHFKTSYQFAGSLCGLGEDAVRNFDRVDSKITEAIATFFLLL